MDQAKRRHEIVVESAGGAETSGRLVDATANVVSLQGTDLAPVAESRSPPERT